MDRLDTPSRVTVPAAAPGGLALEFVSSRRDGDMRRFDARLVAADGTVAGSLIMRALWLGDACDADDLEMRWDRYSGETYEAALVVGAAWPDLDLPGPVLLFETLWLGKAHARGSAWAPPVLAMIDALRRRLKPSVLLLKPFPTEFSGLMSGAEGEIDVAFERRRAAMVRLYARVLGARPIYGEHDDYMWKPLRRSVADPLED